MASGWWLVSEALHRILTIGRPAADRAGARPYHPTWTAVIFATFRRGPLSEAKLPEGQASLCILLGFARCQVRTSCAIVGNTFFFAKLVDLFYIQRDAYPGNASFLKFPN